MDDEKVDSGAGVGVDTKKAKMFPNHDEAMKKCLEENQDDHTKCKSKVEAFKSTSSSSSSSSSGLASGHKKPLTPLRLRSGSLTDV